MRMKLPATRTAHANASAIIGFLAGVGAIACQWLIGALTGHVLNLPPALTVVTPLVTAILGYVLPFLIYAESPTPGPQPTPTPAPPAPPSGG